MPTGQETRGIGLAALEETAAGNTSRRRVSSWYKDRPSRTRGHSSTAGNLPPSYPTRRAGGACWPADCICAAVGNGSLYFFSAYTSSVEDSCFTVELLRKGIATAKIELYIGFDRESLVEENGRYKYKDDPQGRYYNGKVTLDGYGRKHPKHANGNCKLPFPTSSTKMIVDAALSIFEEKVDPLLLVRRVNISAINVIPDSEAKQIQASHQEEQALGQMDLFTDYEQQDAEQEEQQNDLERERRLQEAVLTIKDKFGRNAVLKGTNFLEGARSRERHNEVGGHKA